MGELSIIALTVAGRVFAASSIGKLSGRGAYRSFRDQLADTGLIPRSMVHAAAASLAGIEASAAAALLISDVLTLVAAPGAAWLAESALTVAAAITAVLALGVAVIVRRGTRAPCACFGARSGRPIGQAHLARNLILLTVVCAGLVAAPLAPGRSLLPGAVLAVLVGAVTALLFARWDDIAILFAPPSGAARRARRES